MMWNVFGVEQGFMVEAIACTSKRPNVRDKYYGLFVALEVIIWCGVVECAVSNGHGQQYELL
jgi:hypothetical protein